MPRPFIYESTPNNLFGFVFYWRGNWLRRAIRLPLERNAPRAAWLAQDGVVLRGLPPLRPARGPRQLYLHALTRQAAKFPASHNNTEKLFGAPRRATWKKRDFWCVCSIFLFRLDGDLIKRVRAIDARILNACRVYYIEWGLASRTFSLERVADEECIFTWPNNF
jgi:hypothetical protein